MKDIISKPNIDDIYTDIKNKIINARSKMLKQIDTTMVEVYWYIGKVTYELSENGTRASYGKKVIEEELLKTPYIFEFVGLKENKNYLETDLEKALLSHLTEFLLE